VLEGLTSPLRRAVDAARHVFAPVTQLLDAAEASGKASLSAWQIEKRRRAREEADRLEREAREVQARQRAEAEAERARQAAAAHVPVESLPPAFEPPPMEPPPAAPPPAIVH